ncbi:50S ribosomal protein L33 [Pontibacillus yanchengensis]|nr:50S ribosomal protein L33 [Pontibacillus yanchengensis]
MSNKVVLACVECMNRNYTTEKNPKLNNDRLEVRKFCKNCGKHTLHRETK